MANDDTRLSDFVQLEKWGDFRTLNDRRFYLKRLVYHDSNAKIRAAKFKPGGFNDDTSHLFQVNQAVDDMLIRHQLEVINQVNKLPSDIRKSSPNWKVLQKYINQLSKEYKVHLQPHEDFIPETISRLVTMILNDRFLQDNIGGFKCRVCFPEELQATNRATVVIYLRILEKRNEARRMCALVLAKLKNRLGELENKADGRLPIYNYPVTKLISFIQIGTDTKFELRRILGERNFNRVFPVKFHHALLLDEKAEYYVD